MLSAVVDSIFFDQDQVEIILRWTNISNMAFLVSPCETVKKVPPAK